MVPLNYALAAILLSSPAEPPDPPDALDALVTVRPALRDLALDWEILDSREVRYVLTRGEDFPSDLKLLRRRYADLWDAPPLYDCMRFPDRSLVNDMLAFNRAYRQHLDNRQAMELSNAWELHEMLMEADRLYQIWDLVRDTALRLLLRYSAAPSPEEAEGTDRRSGLLQRLSAAARPRLALCPDRLLTSEQRRRAATMREPVVASLPYGGGFVHRYAGVGVAGPTCQYGAQARPKCVTWTSALRG